MPCSLFGDTEVRFGLDTGLQSDRRQASILTNGDPVLWRIYASSATEKLNAQSHLLFSFLGFMHASYMFHDWNISKLQLDWHENSMNFHVNLVVISFKVAQK